MKHLIKKINDLRKQRQAVILAHNYQLPEIQDIADFYGDSLALSIEAAKTDAAMIVFCGVYFMAETAKILSPQKTVVIPDRKAGCPMADMITIQQLQALKSKHPGAKVLCYVNSSAEVKAASDICCTSANAVLVAEKAFGPEDEILFIPDKYLALYTASQVQRHIIPGTGYCPTHVSILPEYIRSLRVQYPDAEVLVHPECTPAVIACADKVFSTGGMSRYVPRASAQRFIIGTEEGMAYRLKKDNPDKEFYHVRDHALCPNMKKITLEKVLYALETVCDEVTVPDEIVIKAHGSIRRMLQYV